MLDESDRRRSGERETSFFPQCQSKVVLALISEERASLIR